MNKKSLHGLLTHCCDQDYSTIYTWTGLIFFALCAIAIWRGNTNGIGIALILGIIFIAMPYTQKKRK